MNLPRLSSHAWHVLFSIVGAGAVMFALQHISGSLRGSLITDNAVKNLVDTNRDGAMDEREMRKGLEAMLNAITTQNSAYNFTGTSTVDQNDLLFFNATLRNFLNAVCGNGVLETGEVCDDRNSNGGDGCSASCSIELGYGCSGSPSSCARICGNGILDAGEACDDRNGDSGDGCSASCSVETGFNCTGIPSVCSKPIVCGDGLKQADEQCDDQNLVAGDGCSPSCIVEKGFSCNGLPKSLCTRLCGNGALDQDETCEDRNVVVGDGCSATCGIEAGYSCIGSPSICSKIPVCNDGIKEGSEQCDTGGNTATCTDACQIRAVSCRDGYVQGTEQCDDGNAVNDDNCTNECKRPMCGDAILQPSEQCDDGNLSNNDDCNSNCQIPPKDPLLCKRIACTTFASLYGAQFHQFNYLGLSNGVPYYSGCNTYGTKYLIHGLTGQITTNGTCPQSNAPSGNPVNAALATTIAQMLNIDIAQPPTIIVPQSITSIFASILGHNNKVIIGSTGSFTALSCSAEEYSCSCTIVNAVDPRYCYLKKQ